jgi:hypothetical protein
MSRPSEVDVRPLDPEETEHTRFSSENTFRCLKANQSLRTSLSLHSATDSMWERGQSSFEQELFTHHVEDQWDTPGYL